MAQDYVVIEKNEENGMIAINKSVFESIANISIDDIENVVAIKQGRFNKPVTVKFRKGYDDDNINAVEFAKMMEYIFIILIYSYNYIGIPHIYQ